MRALILITQAEIKEVLNYDHLTGLFTWRVAQGAVAKGNQAGTINRGYVVIKIDNKLHKAHRLAWVYTYGYLDGELDHKNRVRHDNSIDNLRLASRTLNARNTNLRADNTTGHKGVIKSKTTGKFCASLKIRNVRKHLGTFTTIEDAIAARKDAESLYW